MPPLRPAVFLVVTLSALHGPVVRAADTSPLPSTPPPRSATPAYPVPYAPATVDSIATTLDRVLQFVERASAIRVVDGDTGQPVAHLTALPANPVFERTDLLLSTYEAGVTYAGAIAAAQATGNENFRRYVAERMAVLASVAQAQRARGADQLEDPAGPARILSVRAMLVPRSLDDSGSLAAAMMKACRADPALAPVLRPWIDNYLAFISQRQFRLADGTLARNRPLPRALWLDDLYMSVPALTEYALLTGDARYFDDAARQVLQFSSRMFVPGPRLYRHGWIESMDPHPAFYWARANGWAVVAMAELLTALPTSHPQRAAVLAQYRAHAAGLVACQGGTGLWHQLLDRTDSYPETSASAMFVYALARGINQGWLDPLAYGPAVSLGWNAVATQVNPAGGVEGTCVGTGMGFDPAFYYYRPTDVLAAHGYGPVLLAGAEMIILRRGPGAAAQINGGAIQFAPSPTRH